MDWWLSNRLVSRRYTVVRRAVLEKYWRLWFNQRSDLRTGLRPLCFTKVVAQEFWESSILPAICSPVRKTPFQFQPDRSKSIFAFALYLSKTRRFILQYVLILQEEKKKRKKRTVLEILQTEAWSSANILLSNLCGSCGSRSVENKLLKAKDSFSFSLW